MRTGSDRLVSEAVKRMMQPRVNGVGQIRSSLAVSERQLRRRFLTATGVPPKAMQRMVRFQGFLAEAQFAVAGGVRPSSYGLAHMAARAGYSDQAHLTRECSV